MKKNVAQDYHDGHRAKTIIEDTLFELFLYDPPPIENFDEDYFEIHGDYYDNSLEVSFKQDIHKPWEPSLKTRQALYDLGFEIVYWNFTDGTEIRGVEPRHSKGSDGWVSSKAGFIDKDFDLDAWLASEYNCIGKIK